MRRLLARSLLLGVAVVACHQLTDAPATRPLHVILERAESGVAFPGNYVSVLDTVVLTVTSPTEQVLTNQRVRLGPHDSTATFTIDVPAETVFVDARVLSVNGTLLFRASQPVQITPTTDPVRITVTPQSPVLLVLRSYAIVDVETQRFFTTTVYNRGAGTLTWSVADTTRSRVCPTLAFCTFVPSGSLIPQGSSATFSIRVPATTSVPPSIVLTSTGGSVPFP